MEISRVTRPKSAARRAYDHLSRYYDLVAGSSETPFINRGLHMLSVNAGDALLEIGCGTGKALIELNRQAGAPSLTCGLDISPGMLHVARNRLVKVGLLERVKLLSGDGAWLPFAPSSFTAVFMCFTLELFDTPEIPQVLAACWRVLKSGGRLAVVAMSKPEQPSWIVRLYEWFHSNFPNYVDCRPIDAGFMLQMAGFHLEIQNCSSMWGLPVELVLAIKT